MFPSDATSTRPRPSAAGRYIPFDAVLPLETRKIGKRAPQSTGSPVRFGRIWLFFLIVCIALGLADAAQVYWVNPPQAGSLGFWRSLGYGLGPWCNWALLWPIAYFMARRFPLGLHHWPSRLLLHLVVSLVCVFLKMTLDYPIIKTCYCPTPEILTYSYLLQLGLDGYVMRFLWLFWAMLGVCHALDYYDKYRDGQLRAAYLETGLTRARLQLLKTQLHPHFLFNTLNAVSALIYTDVEAAERVLARLGDLLRLALEDFGVQEAPLSRELEVVRHYLEIEQARLGPRLRVVWKIAPEVTDALVPTFMLQPLIENAIRHGIAPRSEPGRIEITARREGAQLYVEVRDDGPGLRAGSISGNGVGLANTRARLLHLYGEDQQFEIINDARGGCAARVFLPFYEPVPLAAENMSDLHDTHIDCR
jgi:two-component system, LytTR family, sensor kinase